MTGRHLLDKAGLRFAHILDRLSGHRVRQETDEITGMARRQCDADFAVVLHAANAGAVPGTRVEDDKRPLARVDRSACPRNNPHQGVIDRSWQGAPVQH